MLNLIYRAPVRELIDSVAAIKCFNNLETAQFILKLIIVISSWYGIVAGYFNVRYEKEFIGNKWIQFRLIIKYYLTIHNVLFLNEIKVMIL